MKKVGLKLSGILYETKRQYPFFARMGKGMDTVKRELNKDRTKGK